MITSNSLAASSGQHSHMLTNSHRNTIPASVYHISNLRPLKSLPIIKFHTVTYMKPNPTTACSTRSDTVRIDFKYIINAFPRGPIICTLNPRKDQGAMSHKKMNAVLAFRLRCTRSSPQPFIKETDVSAKCATRSSSHLPQPWQIHL